MNSVQNYKDTVTRCARAGLINAIACGDSYHEEYSNYVMTHADPEEYCICDGDSLLEATENGYLLEEFVDFVMNGGL